MKKNLFFLMLLALCLALAACGGKQDSGESPFTEETSACQTYGHSYDTITVLSEPYGGTDGIKRQTCSRCGYMETPIYPAAALWEGDTFTLTIREFTQRLTTIGQWLCPGLTVELVTDDWSAVTQLRYKGELFCELTYFDSDSYLNVPYLDDPMGPDKLDTASIRHVNLLDYVDAEHAPNSFAVIAMTFDPLITEAQALELAEFLADTRQDYYGNYLVTAINGVGYGHAYPMNQLYHSGSIAIHAGSDAPVLCEHTPDYIFSGDGVPAGYCTKCSTYISPAGSDWTYLTSQDVLSHSNGVNGKDIMVGNWDDPVGAVYWNALKFWVVDSPGLNNTEHIEYALDGGYSTLSGSIVSSAQSETNAVTRIEIYLDGTLAFSSGDIGYYDHENYILDISGADSVRIVCTTDTNAQGYCVMTAALY